MQQNTAPAGVGTTSDWNYWETRTTRVISGVTVSFYKRSRDSAHFTMDCTIQYKRIKISTGATTLKDAERVAALRIKAAQEKRNGLAQAKSAVSIASRGVATIGDIMERLHGGDKVAEVRTMRTYGSSLLRVGRVFSADRVRAAKVSDVLSRENLERFYSKGQGRESGVNWVDRLPCNGGLNSTIRNLRSLFTQTMIETKFADLRLGDLTDLQKLRMLKVEAPGFKPWPVAVYRAMHEASEELKTEDPELWLVNAMLRQLGLRDGELYAARRDWIEEDGTGRAWLVVRDRGDEFRILKHGNARRLELDEGLKAVLLPKEGYLITAHAQVNQPGNWVRTTDGLSDSARYDLIYRKHCQWMRQFIPDRTKANHELRMWAGSMVYTNKGLEAAKYFLGHKSVATTERYYAELLGDKPMLDAAAVAAAAGV